MSHVSWAKCIINAKFLKNVLCLGFMPESTVLYVTRFPTFLFLFLKKVFAARMHTYAHIFGAFKHCCFTTDGCHAWLFFCMPDFSCCKEEISLRILLNSIPTQRQRAQLTNLEAADLVTEPAFWNWTMVFSLPLTIKISDIMHIICHI